MSKEAVSHENEHVPTGKNHRVAFERVNHHKDDEGETYHRNGG